MIYVRNHNGKSKRQSDSIRTPLSQTDLCMNITQQKRTGG